MPRSAISGEVPAKCRASTTPGLPAACAHPGEPRLTPRCVSDRQLSGAVGLECLKVPLSWSSLDSRSARAQQRVEHRSRGPRVFGVLASDYIALRYRCILVVQTQRGAPSCICMATASVSGTSALFSYRAGDGGKKCTPRGGSTGDKGERKGARVGTARRNEFSYKALSVSGEGPGGIRGEEREEG